MANKKKTKRVKKLKNITPRLSPEQIIKNDEKSAVATGAGLASLAGRPSKQAVVACFGKSGYAMSWVARAAKLGIEPTVLCERFKADAKEVKAAWDGIK